MNYPIPYFGPQCPQVAVLQPKIGPQCPYLAVPLHIKRTSTSISGGPTAYYWTSMPPRTWDPGNTGSQAILRTSHPGCHSIERVNWTAILAVIQSDESTGQPSWQPLNQTSKLDSHPGCHSIRPVSESWRPETDLKGGSGGETGPPRKDQMTAAVSQQLWTFGGALVQRAQEPNIPFGESLTSTN